MNFHASQAERTGARNLRRRVVHVGVQRGEADETIRVFRHFADDEIVDRVHARGRHRDGMDDGAVDSRLVQRGQQCFDGAVKAHGRAVVKRADRVGRVLRDLLRIDVNVDIDALSG